MISKKMEERLNQAINLEFNSSYLYLSMAAYCETIGLDGFAGWMRAQASEEWMHGMKLFEYINEQQGCVTLKALDEPKAKWASIHEVFEDTLGHEKKVTAAYNDLMGFAAETNDWATQSFLQWYVDEQIEEESTAAGILEKLNMVKDRPQGILYMDSHVAKRTFSPATGGETAD
jgi:ferritin